MPGPAPDLVRAVPFFANLSDADVAALAPEFDERDYAAGQLIVAEGQHGHAFFLVERGEATVVRHGEELRTLGPGTWFGELALFDREARRSASVTATSDMRCWSLPIFAFRPFVEARPGLAWRLLEDLAARLRPLND